MKITAYQAICNLGNNIDEIYKKAIEGDTSCFDNLEGYLSEGFVRFGLIKTQLPEIRNEKYNIRCNKIILKNLQLLEKEISNLKAKYKNDRIGIVVATTNSGVEEYETTNNPLHFELGNPVCFLRETLETKGFYTTVSTACSSGLKAFSLARDLLNNNISDAVVVVTIDTISKVSIYGFSSLEVVSNEPCLPFSKNRKGMNLAEGSAIFIIEKDSKEGIDIMGLGENSDVYHSTTPDPSGKEAVNAINEALKDAGIEIKDIDYINVHGTGTIANDIMETNAIKKIFLTHNPPASSTKQMTGHCLGAAAGIETALCCKLIDSFDGRMYPHIYDENYDDSLPQINLVKKNEKYEKCNICMCNSFGFGGTNAIMIVGKNHGK